MERNIVEKKVKKPLKPVPSKSHLILKLQAIAQRLDRTPTTADINRLSKTNHSFPLYVYLEAFGGFNIALKKANIPLRYNQEFDAEKLLDELRTLRKKLKRALISKDVQEARRRGGRISSLYHFQRAFGSVPLAIEAAGAARPKFSRAEMISYLKSLHVRLKRIPTGKDIASRFVPGESPSLKEVLRTFKSLVLARKLAGIK